MMAQKHNIYNMASRLDRSFERIMVGEVDDYCVFLVHIGGAYLFHEHIGDEMYLVLEGEVIVDYADGASVTLTKGDAMVAKAGQKHRSRSEEGAKALIFKHKDYLHGKTE